MIYDGDGFDVRFSAPRAVDIAGARSTTALVLKVRTGEQFFTHNSPEVACAMEVVQRGTQAGLEVRGAYRSPMRAPLASQASEFIPAE